MWAERGQDRKSGARGKGLCSSPVGEVQPEPGPRHGAGRAAGGRQALDILGLALPWQAGPWVPGLAGVRGLAPIQPETLLQVSALSWVGLGRSGGEGRPVCPLRGPPLLDPLFGLCLPAFSRGSKRVGWGLGWMLGMCPTHRVVSSAKQPLHGQPSSLGSQLIIFLLVRVWSLQMLLPSFRLCSGPGLTPFSGDSGSWCWLL